MMALEFYCLECIVAMGWTPTPTVDFDIDTWAAALANEENQ